MDNERIIEYVRKATTEVLGTMVGIDAVPGTPYREREAMESFDGIVALVGIGGPWTGMGTLYCTTDFALQVTEAMLMAPQSEINEDVLDALAELSNMIVGNVKTFLEADLGPLALSIPTVIFGRNYRALHGGSKERTVVPFLCDGQRFEVKFCLLKRADNHGRMAGLLQAMC